MQNSSKKNNNDKKNCNRYNRETYKQIAIRLKPIDFEFIDDLAKSHNMSKTSLIIKALLYVAYHRIDLSEEIPNAETIKAMAEVEEIEANPLKHKGYKSIEEFVEALNADIDEKDDWNHRR